MEKEMNPNKVHDPSLIEKLPLERMDNISYEEYWPTIEERAGQEYANAASVNQTKLANLEHSMDKTLASSVPITKGESKDVQEWYQTLGTLNSMRGANDRLRDASTILFYEGKERKFFPELLIDTEKGALPGKTANTLMVGQMLIEIARSTGVKPEEASLLAKTVNKSCDHLLASGGFLRVIQQFDKVPKNVLTNAQNNILNDAKRELSDTLRNKFESQAIVFSAIPATSWAARLQSLSNQANDKIHPNSTQARQTLDLLQGDTHEELVESLTNRSYTALLGRQLKELSEHEDSLGNGDVAEHYFILLARYISVSSRDKIIPVNAATDRQDRPHDGIIGGHERPRRGRFAEPKLSFDATISDYHEPGSREYIQLKAGKSTPSYEYHDGIKIINPFGEVSNEQARKQIKLGMKQLSGIIDEYLTGRMYTEYDVKMQKMVHGKTDVIDAHLGVMQAGLAKHEKQSPSVRQYRPIGKAALKQTV